MLAVWIKRLMLKDSTNFLWLNHLDLIGFCNLQVTIGMSSLDISDRILERMFLHRRILERLDDFSFFVCEKDIKLICSFTLLRRVSFIHKKSHFNIMSINARYHWRLRKSSVSSLTNSLRNIASSMSFLFLGMKFWWISEVVDLRTKV